MSSGAFTVDQNLGPIIIVNLNTGKEIHLDGLFPEDLSEEQSVSFEDITIRGRSSGFSAYSGGGSRTTTIIFTLHEDYLGGYMGIDDIREVVSLLKATIFPVYENSGAIIPPRVYLRIGDTINFKRAYVTSCNVTWKKPIRNGRYIVADVNMGVTEILKVALDTFDVEDMVPYQV